jgi:hypothetical protein
MRGTGRADHQPVSVLVQLVAEALHVLVSLGPERRGDHPPCTLPRQLIQRERDLLVALPDRPAARMSCVSASRMDRRLRFSRRAMSHETAWVGLGDLLPVRYDPTNRSKIDKAFVLAEGEARFEQSAAKQPSAL